MAPIRSATVSVPVEEYAVVLVPSLTVIVPFGGILRLASVVLVFSGTVPVAVAGAGPEGLEAADDAVPDAACRAFSSAAIWLLTRVKAAWVASCANPVVSFVTAEPIAVISASSAVET